jgi:hypothetical protein
MSRVSRRCAAVVLALTVVAAGHVVAQDAPSPFVVGVWGQGDAIIPFADFDGHRWRSSWPLPVEAGLDSTPLRRIPAAWWGRSTFQPTWELVEPDGSRRSVQVTGTAPAGLGSSCSSNLGLKTDAPAETFRYGNVLAANRPGVVEPVDKLALHSADWRTVLALLPDIYHRFEATAWKDMSDDFRPDLSTPLTAPRLDGAFIVRDELGEFAYFESSREFARRRDQQGDERSFITGWLWRRSSAMPFQLVTVRSATNDGDGKGAGAFRPLGVVRQGTQRFWLGTLWSYAYSGVTVLGVSRAGIRQLLLVDYPGC